MKTFIVAFIKDGQKEKQTVLVSARDYTDAYLQVYYKIPEGASITDLFEVI